MTPGRGRIFVISAPSGAGKSTLCRLVRRRLRDLAYSVSLTSRAPRPGEIDGKDYHFVSREDFQARIESGDMAEYAEIFGNYYGTSRKVLDQSLDQGRDILLDIDVKGAAQLRRFFPDGLFIFLLPPSREELERRLRSRGTEDEETIQRRLARADEEISRADQYDFQVINDDLEQAVKEVIAIISPEKA